MMIAEREGFEPSWHLRAKRFSRPPHSATLASLRKLFEAQRFDWVQFRSFMRGIKSRYEPNKNADNKSDDDPQPRYKIGTASQKTSKEVADNDSENYSENST